MHTPFPIITNIFLFVSTTLFQKIPDPCDIFKQLQQIWPNINKFW